MKRNKFQYYLWPLVWLANITGVLAQKNDYGWLAGYNSVLHNVNGDSMEGNIKINFNYDPVQINFDSISMNFLGTDVSFSDSNGNLLFYSNGIYIANALDDTIINGDSLNFGYFYYFFDDPSLGADLSQGIIALPNIDTPNQYYLVHSFADTIPNSNSNYVTKILTTLIDMQANGGEGKIIYKNQPIINTVCGGALSATKHGNGRDWWLPIQKQGSNRFYMVLLDSGGFHITDSIFIGPVIPLIAGPDRTCFSPDGSKYIYMGYYTGVSVYDFDRCTGTLSNYQYLPVIPANIDSGNSEMGVAVSPNNRFLYVATSYQLYQFDLQSNDIFGSIDTVGIYNEWYLWGPGNAAHFNTCQLAPDGKIYISCGGSIPYYQVINNPDEQGSTCNFVQEGISLGTNERGIPNYPNYRLGALTQSQCDTLAGLTEIQRAAKEQIIKVYPNPATDYAIVDYGFTDWSKPQPNLEICNALGQVVYEQVLPMYSGFQKIDVSGYATGVYMVYIKRDGGVVATNKLVKQ